MALKGRMSIGYGIGNNVEEILNLIN
jgi:hypothetical protein